VIGARRVRTATALTLAAVLGGGLLTACSGDEEPAPAPEAAGSPSSSPPEPVPAPFSGRLVPELPDRGALVVKIDNTGAAQPQLGLGKADLVVEELVEGGLTRLAAFYHSRLPRTVGPVRSIRASDIGIVAPTDGVLVASGAAGRVTRAVAAQNIRTVTGGRALSRDGSRSAPYNLMLSPVRLGKPLEGREPPRPYLDWADPDAPAPKGRPAKAVTVRFSPFHTTDWTFAGGTYRRGEELAAQGSVFRPTTLLVLRVRTQDAGYKDPAGNPVPETVLVDGGDALLLHGGTVTRGRWDKKAVDRTITLTDRAGKPLEVPVGRTWLELVPVDGEVTTSRQ
jgi:hypothetical protein